MTKNLGFGDLSWIKYVLILGGVFLTVVASFTVFKGGEKIRDSLGGKVIGIVGRMGSGKTYMAVVIAWQHLQAGHDVRTNFTMRLGDKFYQPRISTTRVQTDEAKKHVEEKTIAPWFHCLPRVSIPWAYFDGWDQFADLSNCVVVIDEAQLYAPSYKPLAFPLLARWKLAMARKFHLDVYWISQHEDRVNSTLRHLTNLIYVCNSWFSAAWFTAKGYEPEYVRRPKKNLARKSYRFRLELAQLYDTLEVLTPDEHLGDEKQSARLDKINDLAGAYNRRRLASKKGQTADEVVAMMQEVTVNARREKLTEEPATFTLEAPEGTCTGLRGNLPCGNPTDNGNGLCDDCVQRARESLRSVKG